MSDSDLLDDVDENGDGLTRWEIDFVESLSRQREGAGEYWKLSPAQRTKLESIWEDKVR